MLRMTALAILIATPLSGVSLAQDALVADVAPVVAGITGKITFKGDAPAPAPVDMASDPVCEGSHAGGISFTTVIVGSGGGLKDVFVSLIGVPDKRYKAPKTAVVLDQRGCTYEPHIFGIMKKQDLEIINSDDTLHNIHAMPKRNKEFNLAMPVKDMKVKKSFKKDEQAILIKCDVHAWMKSYCFSMEHPYFGVSDADGNVTIDTTDLPDGTYGVTLWHETLGTSESSVTVSGGSGSFESTVK